MGGAASGGRHAPGRRTPTGSWLQELQRHTQAGEKLGSQSQPSQQEVGRLL